MNDRNTHRLHIGTESMRFAAAHMTVFPDGGKERLHGHNFRPRIIVDTAHCAFGDTVPMAAFETAMRSICEKWDEKILLAEHCPFLKILRNDAADIEITLCGKRYLFPADEVELLQVDNVSMEALAEEFFRGMVSKIGLSSLNGRVSRVEVVIEATPGLGASYIWEPGRGAADSLPAGRAA